MGQSFSKTRYNGDAGYEIMQRVVAIEIGSTNCGYAYSLSRRVDKIYTGTDDFVLPTDRIPSKCLLHSDGWKLNSIGTAAEDNYRALTSQQDYHKYIFFENMQISCDKRQCTYIMDIEGRQHSAEKVYLIMLQYLYKKCMESIETKTVQANTVSKNMKLIITIPADLKKDLSVITSSVEKITGIKSKSIRIVSEMDAVGLYCTRLASASTGTRMIPIAKKYLLVNLGGTKTEICAKENFKDTIRIPKGGKSVLESFMEELRIFIGMDKTEWTEFQNVNVCDKIGILQTVENIINYFGSSDEHVVIELPPSFITAKISTRKPEEQRSSFTDIGCNKISMPKKTIDSWFHKSIDEVVENMKTAIREFKEGETTILLCGGFAEIPYVRKVIASEMDQNKVILVQRPSLVALKGLVQMGYELDRETRYAYGIELLEEFIEGQHPERFREKRGDKTFCTSQFSNVVEIKKKLLDDERLTDLRYTFHPKTTDEHFFLNFFRSDINKPRYCTDQCCVKLKSITLKPPEAGWNGTFEFTLKLSIENRILKAKIRSSQFEIDTEVGLLY